MSTSDDLKAKTNSVLDSESESESVLESEFDSKTKPVSDSDSESESESESRPPVHVFRDPELERVALTHKSAGEPNNERMEWLGDSVLNAAVSEILWRRFPDTPEGVLTNTRMALVCNETLAEAAERAGFSRRIRVGGAELAGQGRKRQGGRRRKKPSKPSILAAALEAYVAAVRLDGGDPLAAVSVLLDREIAAAISALETGEPDVFKPVKTRLQELRQAEGKPPPEYLTWEFANRHNRPYFRVDCKVDEAVFQGFGKSIRRASDAAARKAMEALDPECGGEDEGGGGGDS